MRGDLPSGTVTFLFTDVEGSTKLLHSLGAEGYAQALAEHRRVIREACASEGGVEVDTQGDAFFFAFPTAPGALAAARGLTERLAAEGPIRVRVGLHTGTPLLGEEGYIGHDLHRAARIAASGHGGQVILSGATASLVDLELADLGEHRLKDIAEPVPIFQLGAERFPPLKTISNTNLPRPASSFLGREAELAEVVSRIEQGARLVTLTGPGGTGKTRLALEAASTLVGEYKAGVFWVGLASLRDPAIVTETIAQVLGAKGGLAEHISEREMLLLLDNLEQVIEAASELASLLESCPNLTVLVTSRELLRVRGEVEYPVPPLAELEAIELFCARSQLEPSAEIAELCARLDSLPLAVELAAARTKGLTPAQIVERLSSRLDLLKGGRDADPRQQTLRATIEWSYDLLTHEEQLLFARLSAFAGGCTLEAAEEVCNADLDTLQSLVEKSLVRFTAYETGGRYWMLETIRGYAAELAATDTGLAVRHSEWIREHVLDGASMWPGQARADGWYEKVDLERDNIRAALESFHARGREADVGLVIGAVGGFWDTLGFGRECDRWLEIALESVTDERLRVRLLTLACRRAGFRHDTDLAMALATELAGLGDRLGDGAVIAAASFDLARAYEIAGNVDAAFDSYSRSAEHWLGVNDGNAAAALVNLAGIELVKGNYAEARRRALASLDISETVKFPEGVITSCGHIGSSLLREGAVDDARPWFRRALAGVLEHRRVILAPGLLVEVASLGTRTHGLERSVVVIGAADAIARSAATELEDDSEQRAAAVLGEAAGLLGSDRVEALLREGSSLNWEQAIEYALASI